MQRKKPDFYGANKPLSLLKRTYLSLHYCMYSSALKVFRTEHFFHRPASGPNRLGAYRWQLRLLPRIEAANQIDHVLEARPLQ